MSSITLKMFKQIIILLLPLLTIFTFYYPAFGLAPSEILVITNSNNKQSMKLSRYYMKQRDIPVDNILQIFADDDEDISQEDYREKIALPVKNFLNSHPEKNIQCLVLMHGTPLRISPPLLSKTETLQLFTLQQKQNILEKEIINLDSSRPEEKKQQQQEINRVKKEIHKLRGKDSEASVDSEIALLRFKDYALDGWLPNPYFLAYKNKPLSSERGNILLVARLDGPSPETVKRIIDNSIETETSGLSGKAYFDARWKEPKNSGEISGYAFYDRSLHRAAAAVKKAGRFITVLNDETDLLPEGSNLDTALYCGWYSLGKYVDAFSWTKGSIGYHIASSECTSLRKKNSTVWCKMMLEKGIAATLGPVSEPYIQAFPAPELFFPLITETNLTLVECYFLSLPFLSWKMVLVGDPLYRPMMRDHKDK